MRKTNLDVRRIFAGWKPKHLPSVTAYAKPKKYPVKKLIFAVVVVAVIIGFFIFR